ncbi:hypothetical protein CTAM01_07969 [Colletotrichum tamarilloi]|uniref:Uncharacterized protein n=1 Tax=Colletotrichum tamarilloi TaxID=1209934 RepID=A0ABQ9R7P9_9PEZI|nr:uncharacterized protein CTAM01_07969 [Colletotrichum tamarilloi]KAK1497305.1 hypothetical protein CTAM01_07969 [Colletotrichum tamarilloi]
MTVNLKHGDEETGAFLSIYVDHNCPPALALALLQSPVTTYHHLLCTEYLLPPPPPPQCAQPVKHLPTTNQTAIFVPKATVFYGRTHLLIHAARTNTVNAHKPCPLL